MPDNVSITPGTGAIVAADEVDGALFQRMKLTLGADGVNGGDVSTSNPLPVAIDSNLTVDIASSGELDVNVTNVELGVSITNTALDVNVLSSPTVDTNITNAELDVVVVNTSPLEAIITNTSPLEMLITNSTVEVTNQAVEALRRIASLLKPLQQVTGGGSNRLSVDVNSGTLGTVSTVSTVSTVNNLTSLNGIGGVSAFDMMKALSRQAFNTGIRGRIS